ncbi:MAG: DnaJ domain-containing protein [Symploca sp. SIO2G7]|nr:DnaJ domain-containing protein [Symploca sp. SIO2G7]
MQDARSYYKILQVSTNATIEAIKQAYRRLARQYHPDLNPNNPEAADRFKEICEAYEVLSDSVQRAQYDQGFDDNRSRAKKANMSHQDFYVRAAAKALKVDYKGAVADYTQAIELNPRFIEAYLKRGEILYKLGDARGTLRDCNQALSLNPNLVQAHYYKGRARYRLGYTQAAIEAYTQAINQEPDHAEAYYHRSLAYKDLEERSQAFQDLQQATALFREQGDGAGYQLAQETLKIFKRSPRKLPITLVQAVFGDALKTFQLFALNPVGGLLPAFGRLDKQQIAAVGIVFALVFDCCFIFGFYLGWQDLLPQASIFKLIVVGIVPFVSLATVSRIARLICRCSGNWAGDMFLAGATLLPAGVLALASGISNSLGVQAMVAIAVFTSCYLILTLYSGCTQIAHLSEQAATLLIPVMLLVSGWCFYFFVQIMFIN